MLGVEDEGLALVFAETLSTQGHGWLAKVTFCVAYLAVIARRLWEPLENPQKY